MRRSSTELGRQRQLDEAEVWLEPRCVDEPNGFEDVAAMIRSLCCGAA
jgi:hypothetical protein